MTHNQDERAEIKEFRDRLFKGLGFDEVFSEEEMKKPPEERSFEITPDGVKRKDGQPIKLLTFGEVLEEQLKQASQQKPDESDDEFTIEALKLLGYTQAEAEEMTEEHGDAS